MQRIRLPRLRGLCLIFVLGGLVYLGMQAFFHSPWYKERLYRELLGETKPTARQRAASALAYLGAEKQLLAAVKSDLEPARTAAQPALEYLWFSSGGARALHLTQQAHRAAENEDLQTALDILNRLVGEFPRFAEGWNRRASVYWKLGRYDESIADCERALALNPNHYGAWQGIGICRLQKGDVSEACRCLRAALRIIPHDEATRRVLEQCEALRRAAQAAEGVLEVI